VLLAEASDAVIVGFHVVASQHARDLAEQRGVDVRLYRVIYPAKIPANSPVVNQTTKKPGITKHAKNSKGTKLIINRSKIPNPPIKPAFKLEVTVEPDCWPLLAKRWRRDDEA
jgi:hypothetical protein